MNLPLKKNNLDVTAPNLVLRITGHSAQDRRRYNRPTAQEVGAFIPD